MRKVEVRGKMVDISSTLTIGNETYILDTTGVRAEPYQLIWIVRIVNKDGKEVTCRRIAGIQADVDKAASEWLNDLLGMNPGIFLSYRIETWIRRD